MKNNAANVNKNSQRPLEGIRILEYAIFHAGPGGSAILGDLGAEIIKIESLEGDPERNWTRVGDFSFELPHNRSLIFDFSNRNKRGITLDIKKKQGKEIFHKLVKNCDIFLTNLRKSTKQKLGIDYETLAAINPQIIHANVSGYGPNGPLSDVGAFDPMGQARSGMMFCTGNGEPVLLQLAVLDQATAIAASHSMLSALLARERLGISQEIHVSIFSTALWLYYANLMTSSLLGVNGVIAWDREHNTPLRNTFVCKDGKWIMGVHHPPEKYWERLCKATGLEYLTADPKFLDEDKRNQNCPELISIFDKVFIKKTRDEWADILIKHNLMYCPVHTFNEVLNDPQAIENEYIKNFDHPDLGKIQIPGYPVHFSKNIAGTHRAAPSIGQHTNEVLDELGYTKQQIVQLGKEKII